MEMFEEIIQSDDTKAQIAMLFGAMQMNATYSALNFFQGQAERPLKDDEILHVNQKIINEIGHAMKEAMKVNS